MKKEVELEFRNIDLGIKIQSDPQNDRHLYLVIDDFQIKLLDGYVLIDIIKHHVKEYPVNYCVDCLAEGKRNTDYYTGMFSQTERWYRCKDHYAKYMREKDPQWKCPKCEVGYMKECGIENEDRGCTHCGYRVNVRPTCATSVIPELLAAPIVSDSKWEILT